MKTAAGVSTGVPPPPHRHTGPWACAQPLSGRSQARPVAFRPRGGWCVCGADPLARHASHPSPCQLPACFLRLDVPLLCARSVHLMAVCCVHGAPDPGLAPATCTLMPTWLRASLTPSTGTCKWCHCPSPPVFYAITASWITGQRYQPWGSLQAWWGSGTLLWLAQCYPTWLLMGRCGPSSTGRCSPSSKTPSAALPWAGFNHVVATGLRSCIVARWGVTLHMGRLPLSLEEYTGFGLEFPHPGVPSPSGAWAAGGLGKTGPGLETALMDLSWYLWVFLGQYEHMGGFLSWKCSTYIREQLSLWPISQAWPCTTVSHGRVTGSGVLGSAGYLGDGPVNLSFHVCEMGQTIPCSIREWRTAPQRGREQMCIRPPERA